MQKGIIKNVNKLTGEPIDAKDLASMLSGIIGNESGVLTVFDELRLEKISDNKVRLHSGVYSLKGHILYIPKGSYEDFEIESGTLGANRIDLLVAEYVKNGEGDGEDTLRFRVIKGEATSGTPKEPSLIQQDINENGINRQEALYRITLQSLNLRISSQHKIILNIEKLKKNTAKSLEKLELDMQNFLEVNYRKTDYVAGRPDLNKWTGNGVVFSKNGFANAPAESTGYGFVESIRYVISDHIYVLQRFTTLTNEFYTRVYTTKSGSFTTWRKI